MKSILKIVLIVMTTGILSMVNAVTISGTVKDSTNTSKNISGATVALRAANGFTALKTVTTDTAGVFTIDTALSAGTFSLRVTAAGYVQKTESITVTGVTSQTINQNILLVAIHYSTLSGTITDSLTSTTKLDNAIVTLTAAGIGQTPRRDTTPAAGTYSFDSVAYGTYTISVSHAGYVTQTVNDTVNSSTQTANVALTPIQFSTVTGTVTDTLTSTVLDNVIITLTRVGSGTKRDTTGANGVYTLDSVANGASWTLTASHAGYLPGSVAVSASGTGSQTVDVKLIPIQYSTVTGVVTDSMAATTTNLDNVVISLMRIGSTTKRDTTGTDGVYSLDSVDNAGPWNLTAMRSGYLTKTISVSGSGTGTVDIQLVKIEISRIIGVITDSTTGDTVSGAIVSLRQGTTVIALDTTGTNGAYTLTNVSSGTYTVRVQATNYRTRNVSVTTRGTADQVTNIAVLDVNIGVKVLAGRISAKPVFSSISGRDLRLSNLSGSGTVTLLSVDGKMIASRAFSGRSSGCSLPIGSGKVFVLVIKSKTARICQRIVLP
jgi:large repetitive protein